MGFGYVYEIGILHALGGEKALFRGFRKQRSFKWWFLALKEDIEGRILAPERIRVVKREGKMAGENLWVRVWNSLSLNISFNIDSIRKMVEQKSFDFWFQIENVPLENFVRGTLTKLWAIVRLKLVIFLFWYSNCRPLQISPRNLIFSIKCMEQKRFKFWFRIESVLWKKFVKLTLTEIWAIVVLERKIVRKDFFSLFFSKFGRNFFLSIFLEKLPRKNSFPSFPPGKLSSKFFPSFSLKKIAKKNLLFVFSLKKSSRKNFILLFSLKKSPRKNFIFSFTRKITPMFFFFSFSLGKFAQKNLSAIFQLDFLY